MSYMAEAIQVVNTSEEAPEVAIRCLEAMSAHVVDLIKLVSVQQLAMLRGNK